MAAGPRSWGTVAPGGVAPLRRTSNGSIWAVTDTCFDRRINQLPARKNWPCRGPRGKASGANAREPARTRSVDPLPKSEQNPSAQVQFGCIVADISGAKNLNWKPHERTVRGCPSRFVTGYSRKRPGSGLRFNSNAPADSAAARSAEAAATHERTDPLVSYLRAGGAYACTR